MLNSTKTWQKKFDEMSEIEEFWGLPYDHLVDKVVKQFISDLRKRDMEALIKMLPKKKLGHINQEGFCDDCHFKICRCYQTNSIIDTFKKIIKDYYEK